MAEGNTLDVTPLITAIARANHNYFVRRGQQRVQWDELAPIYRHHALEAFTEIASDGVVDLVVASINDAKSEASILRFRLLTFIDELRGSPFELKNNAQFADVLQAVVDRPLED